MRNTIVRTTPNSRLASASNLHILARTFPATHALVAMPVTEFLHFARPPSDAPAPRQIRLVIGLLENVKASIHPGRRQPQQSDVLPRLIGRDVT